MNRRIKTAAETVISMCTDYLTGTLTEEHFVATLLRFAKLMDKEISSPEQQTNQNNKNKHEH